MISKFALLGSSAVLAMQYYDAEQDFLPTHHTQSLKEITPEGLESFRRSYKKKYDKEYEEKKKYEDSKDYKEEKKDYKYDEKEKYKYEKVHHYHSPSIGQRISNWWWDGLTGIFGPEIKYWGQKCPYEFALKRP